MMMNNFDQRFLDELLVQASQNPLLRHVYVMKEAEIEGSQRRLKAMQPGTVIPIHQHPNSAENVLCLRGKLYEVIYRITPDPSVATVGADYKVTEVERHKLCPGEGLFGCQVPAGSWHTIEVLEPSVVFESNEGRYKQDGTTYLEDFEANAISTDIEPPKKEVVNASFKEVLLSVLPRNMFALKKLPFWCLLIMDSLVIVATGVLAMFCFVSDEPLLSDLWSFLYFWIASLPIFILMMMLFGTCKGFFKKSNLANLLASASAYLFGGLLLIGFCWIDPNRHFAFLPLFCAVVVTCLLSALVQTCYRYLYKLMLKSMAGKRVVSTGF